VPEKNAEPGAHPSYEVPSGAQRGTMTPSRTRATSSGVPRARVPVATGIGSSYVTSRVSIAVPQPLSTVTKSRVTMTDVGAPSATMRSVTLSLTSRVNRPLPPGTETPAAGVHVRVTASCTIFCSSRSLLPVLRSARHATCPVTVHVRGGVPSSDSATVPVRVDAELFAVPVQS
jgi:hypothetical protein